MARRRHHRRRFSSTVSVPSLSDLPLLGDSAKVADVAVGIGLGLVAAGAVKAAAKKFGGASYMSLENAVGSFLPIVTGAGAAALVYYGETKLLKRSHSQAVGHASGAALAGVALTVWDLLKQYQPLGLDFSETVGVQLGRYRGLLINDNSDRAMNGLLITDHSDTLNELAAMSMGDDDVDDVLEMGT